MEPSRFDIQGVRPAASPAAKAPAPSNPFAFPLLLVLGIAAAFALVTFLETAPFLLRVLVGVLTGAARG